MAHIEPTKELHPQLLETQEGSNIGEEGWESVKTQTSFGDPQQKYRSTLLHLCKNRCQQPNFSKSG